MSDRAQYRGTVERRKARITTHDYSQNGQSSRNKLVFGLFVFAVLAALLAFTIELRLGVLDVVSLLNSALPTASPAHRLDSLPGLAPFQAVLTSNHARREPKMAQKAPTRSLNVFNKPLGLFSKNPMTGFYRNGYCDVGPEDVGNHAVAAEVTDEFLEFSASRGNDLRSIGLTGGCKWCLCAGRWREALEARKDDSDPIVPKVFLHATHARALDSLKLDDLKKFAAKGENADIAQTPSDKTGAAVREI